MRTSTTQTRARTKQTNDGVEKKTSEEWEERDEGRSDLTERPTARDEGRKRGQGAFSIGTKHFFSFGVDGGGGQKKCPYNKTILFPLLVFIFIFDIAAPPSFFILLVQTLRMNRPCLCVFFFFFLPTT
jgi:hypothetical protein